MTHKEKMAVAERIAATVNMMMGETGQGYWTLEDYDHVITFAWFDTGNGFACDITIENEVEGSSNHTGTITADKTEISNLVLSAFD